MVERRVKYEDVGSADLYIDAVYCSPRPSKNGYADDVLTVMLHNCRNTGGFRVPHRTDKSIPYVGLHLCGYEPAWPDSFDVTTGILTYYGDNREGGKGVEDTSIGGNRILREMFDNLCKGGVSLKKIPPILVFQNTGEARDVRFLGLAVPGVKDMHEDDYYSTVWREKDNVRFPNYVAKFTVLDLEGECIKREWIEALMNSPEDSNKYMPKAWKKFLIKGLKGIKALEAPPVAKYPGKQAQLPQDDEGKQILLKIYNRFRNNPTGFEKLCIKIMYLLDSRYRNIHHTRPTSDGGRDAVAEYIISAPTNNVVVECAMEAKCYKPYGKDGKKRTTVGVHETSRLISRIRNRQFGLMMTTSVIAKQAYEEIKEDGQPILFCTGRDIVEVLQQKENVTSKNIEDWLDMNIED